MEIVIICAVGVGGATLLGAVLGFFFRDAAMRYSALITSIAAGIMLSAAISGLVEPAFEAEMPYGVAVAGLGIFAGALTLHLIERYVTPRKHDTGRLGPSILFAIAIAIHNLPEGIAAGVGFGSERIDEALAIAIGIAIHNIPEGMIVIAPMLSEGVKPTRALIYAAAGGVAEIIGTFLGYYAVNAVLSMLPFALSFAGGTMLYVIAAEMIPEGQRDGGRRATFSLILGFTVMSAINALVS